MFSQNLKFLILNYLDDAITIRYFCQIFPELTNNDRYWAKKYNDKLSSENLLAFHFNELPGMIYITFITELVRIQDQRSRQDALHYLLNCYGIPYIYHHRNDMIYYKWCQRQPFYNDLTVEQMAEYLLAEYWLNDYRISFDISCKYLRSITDPNERYQATMQELKNHPLPDTLPWLSQN